MFLSHFPTETYVIYMPKTRQNGLGLNSGREDRMRSQQRQRNKKLESIQKEWSGGQGASMTTGQTTPLVLAKFTNIFPRNEPSEYTQHTHNK
jgi:hypothetical protein